MMFTILIQPKYINNGQDYLSIQAGYGLTTVKETEESWVWTTVCVMKWIKYVLNIQETVMKIF